MTNAEPMISPPHSPSDPAPLSSRITRPPSFVPRRSAWPGLLGVAALVAAVAALTWLSQDGPVASAPSATTTALAGAATAPVEPQPAPTAAPMAAPAEAPVPAPRVAATPLQRRASVSPVPAPTVARPATPRSEAGTPASPVPTPMPTPAAAEAPAEPSAPPAAPPTPSTPAQ